ncbi:hypothetical protein CHS0354_006222 [Potamilus streckersoni]|uniref:Uncharacterized protein n=1 Tax=Potamilus streckersoni TaxID=2493646 RepID=A0AAE0VP45_9BIVA|nr:hypothetical protein CHS0354_006222 [Potamilus streckersoni]
MTVFVPHQYKFLIGAYLFEVVMEPHDERYFCPDLKKHEIFQPCLRVRSDVCACNCETKEGPIIRLKFNSHHYISNHAVDDIASSACGRNDTAMTLDC